MPVGVVRLVRCWIPPTTSPGGRQGGCVAEMREHGAGHETGRPVVGGGQRRCWWATVLLCQQGLVTHRSGGLGRRRAEMSTSLSGGCLAATAGCKQFNGLGTTGDAPRPVSYCLPVFRRLPYFPRWGRCGLWGREGCGPRLGSWIVGCVFLLPLVGAGRSAASVWLSTVTLVLAGT